jgi:MFS family permease
VKERLPDCPSAGPVREPRAIHAVILLVTSGLTTLVTAVLGPSLPKMQAHFAAAAAADYLVPLTMTVPMLVMALLSILMGSLADRLGRKRILVCATGLYAVFGTAPLWLPSLESIFASRVALGVTEAALMTVSTTMIGDYFSGNRRQKFMALQTTVAAGSAFFLNLLGGAIGEYGWRAPYAVYGISIPLAILMAVHLWEPKPTRAQAAAGMHVPDEAGISFDARGLAGICLVGAVVGLVFLIVPVHLGYLFGALGIRSSAAIGIAYGLNSLGVVTGTLCFGWVIAGRLLVPGQLALAALLTAAGFIGMALAASYATLTAAAVLNGFGAGLLLPTAVTWNMRELPFSRRGLGVGAFQSSLYLGMFANPLLVVSLERALGGRSAAVGVVGAGLALAAVAAFLIALRGYQSPSASPSRVS